MVYSLIALLTVSIAANIVLWQKLKSLRGKVIFLFNAVDNGDYAFRFHSKENEPLNRIKEILQHARDEQMEREKYYETITDSVDTGIIVTDKERGIVLRANTAARNMLGRDSITHISQVADKLKAFAVRKSYVTLKGRQAVVTSFSDIHGELANQEVDAWAKLTRVLTHEIMNTITPIISLSEASLTGKDGQEAMRVIHDTGKELASFVESYRQFTHVPTPHPTLFYVKPFLERMASLSSQWLSGGSIGVSVEPKDLLVYADESLVSRVVSNLLKNAAEATDGKGHIDISAYSDNHDNVNIDITDDGRPIPADVAARIFVPFFTTKPAGSGIGLSVSRQIMRAMGGMIALAHNDGTGVTFRLTFL